MKYNQRLLDASVHFFKKLKANDPSVEPEDGFIYAMEELDFGYDLTHEEWAKYAEEVTNMCRKEGLIPAPPAEEVSYEQLPDNILQQKHGDFAACEGAWNDLTEDMAMRLVKAATSVLTMMERTVPEEFQSWESAKKHMEENGSVLHLPIGYLRAKNDHKKCPLCGCAIIGMGALSRYDNKTEICSSCGMREAFGDHFGYVEG